MLKQHYYCRIELYYSSYFADNDWKCWTIWKLPSTKVSASWTSCM